MEIEQPNDVGLLVKLGGFIGSHIMIEEKKKELTYFTRKVIITGKMIKKIDKNTSS